VPAKYVTVDGTAVHYLHTGPTTLPDVPPIFDRGRLLVFLHAAGSNAGMWRRQLEGLGGRHAGLAVDLPGHGRSSGVEGMPTVEAYADFFARFVEAVGLQPFVLVGRSMGGAVALAYAARRPERVLGLVLTCTSARFTLSPESIRAVYDVVRGRVPQQFTTETFSPATGMDLMREAWTEQVKTDPRVRHGDLLACQAFDGRGLLAGIRTPTLVVAGADDQVTPLAQSEELAAGIPGASLEVILEAGHQAPLEQSARYNELLADFAERLR
jgi:3-oxoadipate enol-lactonase/4-carboxymuconolactone decarboxylase